MCPRLSEQSTGELRNLRLSPGDFVPVNLRVIVIVGGVTLSPPPVLTGEVGQFRYCVVTSRPEAFVVVDPTLAPVCNPPAFTVAIAVLAVVQPFQKDAVTS